jgi:hypothetical protein
MSRRARSAAVSGFREECSRQSGYAAARGGGGERTGGDDPVVHCLLGLVS